MMGSEIKDTSLSCQTRGKDRTWCSNNSMNVKKLLKLRKLFRPKWSQNISTSLSKKSDCNQEFIWIAKKGKKEDSEAVVKIHHYASSDLFYF